MFSVGKSLVLRLSLVSLVYIIYCPTNDGFKVKFYFEVIDSSAEAVCSSLSSFMSLILGLFLLLTS